MFFVVGFSVGVIIHSLRKQNNELDELREAVLEHLESHYQDRIDEMFYILTSELDDE